MELQDAAGRSTHQAYELDPASASAAFAGQAAAGAALTNLPGHAQLPELAVGPMWLHARVAEHEREVMVGAGIRTVGGGATMGRAHPFRVLRLTPGEAQ